MPDSPTLTIPKDVIEPIIQAHVAKAISEALGGRDALVEQAVSAALNGKVGDDGKPSTYTGERSPTFLQWLVRDAIRKAATQAVHDYLAGDVERIKALVAKEIKNQRSTLTKSLIDGIAKAVADDKRFNITVNVAGVAAGY